MAHRNLKLQGCEVVVIRSHLPENLTELAPFLANLSSSKRLPRLHGAGPSAALDKSVVSGILLLACNHTTPYLRLPKTGERINEHIMRSLERGCYNLCWFTGFYSSQNKKVRMSIELASMRAVILDMDGVLWRADEVLPGVAEFFEFVQQRQIKFALATNNSTKMVDTYVERLNRFSIPAGPEHVITSAVATCDYISHRYSPGTPVYVIGGDGILRGLAERGYPHDPQRAEIVVVGMDFQVSYEKLKTATLLIRAGASFIGTNGDRTFPTPEGVVPGNGSILASIQTATDVEPVVIGKPERAMFDVALDRLGTAPDETLMIGDRLETDILGAQRAGLKTALVLTGIATAEEARTASIQADAVFDELPDLHAAWAVALESVSK